EQGGEAVRPSLTDVLPDLGLGTDVDAPRRMGGDEHEGAGGELTADDELLLVASRQGACGDVDTGRPHVELLTDQFGAFACSGAVHPEPLRERVLGLVAERSVLPEGRVEEQAVGRAVLRDEPDAGLAAVP